ncbi:AAA family ATPase, partial [Acinetobacter baumannii]
STAFHAKDSGAIGNLILNDLDVQPDQLDSILNQAKNHINSLSESQAKAQKELDDWDSEVLAAESLEDFEELKAKLPQGHVFVRQ